MPQDLDVAAHAVSDTEKQYNLASGWPYFADVGECALTVEFGRTIDPQTNDRVLALDQDLLSAGISGVEEIIPTYRSVMIHYDPLVIARDELVRRVAEIARAPVRKRQQRRWRFPACYDALYANDMSEVGWTLGLTEGRIVELHSGKPYRIFMHGFAPGLPALGGLPAELRLPRRMSPRAQVPAGSLIIAAGQASIASIEMPSGWHIIGRTPVRLFVPERADPFLTRTGDEIVFESVDAETFRRLEQRAQAGETIAEIIG